MSGRLIFLTVMISLSGSDLPAAEGPDSGTGKTGIGALDVRVVRDVAYRPLREHEVAARSRNKLDLYLPKDKKSFPVLLFVHGGAWRHGDKSYFGMYATLGLYWARQGYGFVSVNYRLSPEVKHPEHVRDVASAVAWVKARIHEYGGAADQVYLMGHSAGGHLIALLAADDKYLKEVGLTNQCLAGVIPISGVYRIHDLQVYLEAGLAKAAPKAPVLPTTRLVPFSSVFGADGEARQASPLTHIRAGLPPFLVLHADQDLITLPEMAKDFARALADKGCSVTAVEVPKRNHISILLNMSRPGDPASRVIAEFLAKHQR